MKALRNTNVSYSIVFKSGKIAEQQRHIKQDLTTAAGKHSIGHTKAKKKCGTPKHSTLGQ